MKKALLIDFYDSFTFNIASSLREIGIVCEVVKVDQCTSQLNKLIQSNTKSLLILGPGPGHPSEYSFLSPLLMKTLQCPNIFHMGICLGHQILLSLKGGEIDSSKKPMHGRKQQLEIPQWSGWFLSQQWGEEITVQRYNSLCVKIQEVSEFKLWHDECGELMGSFGQNFVTYQFHPESVGTTGQKCLFSPLFNFYYNGTDGKSVKAQRTL